ncbi:MAG TPA: gamma carbonic anhydrase family protein [Polyangiaceae bacterium]|jgi:carbonic anhydrase/acetyltransferase-like protein (isoleucine patch superfamily)|nr:gamma carbonic anhydrase family protein [Polyangiaceae bacterium]
MALIRPYLGKTPEIPAGAFIADNATLIGDVVLGEDVNVWFGAVLRGDVGWIHIGRGTNVQDLSCVHTTTGVSNTDVGEYVTIGHGVILHGAKIGDGCLIGMGSVILDNADIGAESLVAAGTVVTPRTVIPPRSLVRGQPGKVVRELNEGEWLMGRASAHHYIELARNYR